MRAPWRLLGRRKDEGLAAAEEARCKAESDLEQTRRETPAYAALAERFRDIRQENHFGEAIAHTYREQK